LPPAARFSITNGGQALLRRAAKFWSRYRRAASRHADDDFHRAIGIIGRRIACHAAAVANAATAGDQAEYRNMSLPSQDRRALWHIARSG
jgi:hypothetical protein